jgi:hypothetical protein
MTIAILFLGFFTSAQLDLPARVDGLVHSVLDDQQLSPKTWSDQLSLQSLDLAALLHSEFPEGIAYGATATKVISIPYVDIIQFLSAPDAIYSLVTNVPTLRDIHKISEDKDQLQMSLAIKVPVVSDFHTVIESKIYQDAKGRKVLIWQQVGDSPDLVYNEGAVICAEAQGKTRVFAIGIHILKSARKVPWLGRGTASAFAKTHYGNFITALEKTLKSRAQAQSH